MEGPLLLHDCTNLRQSLWMLFSRLLKKAFGTLDRTMRPSNSLDFLTWRNLRKPVSRGFSVAVRAEKGRPGGEPRDHCLDDVLVRADATPDAPEWLRAAAGQVVVAR